MSIWLATASAVSSGAAVACLLPPATRHRPARSAVSSRRTARRAPTVSGLRAVPAAVVGIGAALLVGGWPGVVLGTVAMVVVWRVVGGMEPASVRRHRELLLRSLPHAVDLMASALSVGASPTSAVQLVARAVEPPMRDELELVAGRLALGGDPVRVWAEVAGHPQLGSLGRCLVRASESGASVAEAMHRLAEDLRRTSRADVEMRARAVGVQAAAPLGLCLLPAFILTGIVPLVAGSVEVLLLGR